MPITYQIYTEKNQFLLSLPPPPPPTGGREKGKEKLDFLPLDNWWVIGLTFTRRTKSINKINILKNIRINRIYKSMTPISYVDSQGKTFPIKSYKIVDWNIRRLI